MKLDKKLAFVIPWYGENITGGAEAALRGLVHHLSDAGVDLEVLTTCVKDFPSDWGTDYHKPGLTTEAGIRVRRFPVRKPDRVRFDALNSRLMQGRMIRPEDELPFIREGIDSDALSGYIREHADEYGLFVFIPYMFGTTFSGCMACPEKAVMIPCLHDESYAHLGAFRDCYSGIAGMIFHACPEQELAQRLFRLDHVANAVLGTGLSTQITGDGDRFRKKYGIREPFLLYAGRKEAGKRVDLLLEYFARYHKDPNASAADSLKLVLIGGGQIHIPEAVQDSVIDLGFVDVQDKYDAYAAAELLCQPSTNESFSLVIMESWLMGRPVLVNGGCPVTKDFAIRFHGGLYFDNYPEFLGTVDYILTHPEEARQMGAAGGEAVRQNFDWDVIVERYCAFFASLMEKTRSL